MAMLLAMYQKMRLIREKNQATLDLTRFSSKYDRVSKNIERVQKMYTSKIASLESRAKLMMSQAKSIFQLQSGLAIAGNSAFLDPYSGYGTQNGFQMQRLASYMKDGINGVEWNKEKGFVAASSKDAIWKPTAGGNVEKLYNYYMQNGNISSTQEDGKDTYKVGDNTGITKDDLNQFNALLAQAQREYFGRTQMLNQSTSNYETNVSIWLEAAKAELEAEQDAAVEPLAYQQTMWELEKEQTETRLTMIKEELQKYDQLLGDECKGHAPRFGLG